MTDILMIFGMGLGLVVVSALLLVMRDARRLRRRRRQEERRPVAERIANIHDDATFMIEQLQGILERNALERPQAVALIPAVLEYYRRLAALASSEETSAADAVQLAQEASRYLREHQIKGKGIFVSAEAEKLAELLRMRNAG